MKIQELAIIFVIIILPISILLSEYTQFQIQTIKTQTEYDTKLTAATYDAMKAFQLNSFNETFAENANTQNKEILYSVNSFRNSIMSTFKLNGYTEEELNNYIPALVYTLYDGLYIYSPYENTNYRYQYEIDAATGEIVKDRYTDEPIYVEDASGNKIPAEGNGEDIYGLKPYINYSCRYKKGTTDVVITYALDNNITVQGMVDGNYVNKSGYLIDNIAVTGDTVKYNGVNIEPEVLMENVAGQKYKYAKIDGIKYYLMENYLVGKDENGNDIRKNSIVSIMNGRLNLECSEGSEAFTEKLNIINNNTLAQDYYKVAEEFTAWFKKTDLINLTYGDSYDEVIDANTGKTNITQIWPGDDRPIFEDRDNNIENELSNFNQHRLAIIRHKIETNLAIAISNYNEYSGVRNVFQMPQIKEDEWEQITHNISLISFLQGLPIGGKLYNGYTIVTDTESEKVVLEQYIYILGTDGDYHKIGDNNFEVDDNGVYGTSAGRLNLDFKRNVLTNSGSTQSLYYYPLKAYNASYNSVVMQNDVTTYDDIYKYVEGQTDALKKAFYTALGRERAAMYWSSRLENFKPVEVIPGVGGDSADEDETLQTYTVAYDGNSGVMSKGPDTKIHGVNLTLTTVKPTKTGYNFIKWNTKADGTGDSYQSGGIYSTDANVTLYAIWEEKMCTLELYPNGGAYTTGKEKITATIGFGKTITIPPEQANPTRSGYTFLGYSESPTATIQSYIPGQSITLDRDLKLYAVWKRNTGPLTVTFNPNGGTWTNIQPNGGVGTNLQPITINVAVGTTITLLPAPQKSGYIFDGWILEQQNSLNPIVYPARSAYKVNENTTFTAKWIASGNTSTM